MPFFSVTDWTTPLIVEIIALAFGFLASNNSWTLGRPWVISPVVATPPVWKVLIVSWVPGSPIDWAAIIPTASPILTGVPFAGLIP